MSKFIRLKTLLGIVFHVFILPLCFGQPPNTSLVTGHKFNSTDEQPDLEESTDEEIDDSPDSSKNQEIALRISAPLPFKIFKSKIFDGIAKENSPFVFAPNNLSEETYTLSPGSVVLLSNDFKWNCDNDFDVRVVIYQDHDLPDKKYSPQNRYELCVPFDLLNQSDVEKDVSGYEGGPVKYRLTAPEITVYGYLAANKITKNLSKSLKNRIPGYKLPSDKTPTRDFYIVGDWKKNPNYVVIQPKGSPYKYLTHKTNVNSYFMPVAELVSSPAVSPETKYYKKSTNSKANAATEKSKQQYVEHSKQREDERNRAKEMSRSASDTADYSNLSPAIVPYAKHLLDHSKPYEKNKIASSWYNGQPAYADRQSSIPREVFNANSRAYIDKPLAHVYMPSDRCKGGVIRFGDNICYVSARGVGTKGSKKISGSNRNGSKCSYAPEDYRNGSLPINPPSYYTLSNHGVKSKDKNSAYGSLSTTYLSPSTSIETKAGEERAGLLVHSGRANLGSIEARPTHGCLRMDHSCQLKFNTWRNKYLEQGTLVRLIPKEVRLTKELGMNENSAVDERLLLQEVIDEKLLSYIQ